MKIRFHVKAQDDAIQEQAQVINNVTQAIDRFLREFDRWLQMPVETPEFNVNLSDQSPFKKLDNKQIKNREMVEKVWNELPRFMYTDEELSVFEKEYEAIKIELFKAGKKALATSINKTLGFIARLADDEKAKVDLERVKKFNSKIEARFKQVAMPGFPALPNLTGAKSLAELAVNLQPFVQTLKA